MISSTPVGISQVNKLNIGIDMKEFLIFVGVMNLVVWLSLFILYILWWNANKNKG